MIEVKGDVVRLGIEAQTEIPIYRSEVYERIRENERTLAPPMERLDHERRSELYGAVIDHRRGRIVEPLAADAHVNRKDNGGRSPLHFAAQQQVVEIAQSQINSGAEVDSKDKAGKTPLWRAVSDHRGDGRLIVLLRKNAADALAQNREGVSPVGLARKIVNYDVAKLFRDLNN